MKKITFIIIVLMSVIFSDIYAQDFTQKGQISGSFESNSMYYVKDTKITPIWKKDGDPFASNNYLKLDYTYNQFSAGIQLEGYFPVLKGFDLANIKDYKKFFLGSKYIQWEDQNFAIRMGNIYEQFGNGIIFRSYEDRTLGYNNSIEGVSAKYSFNNIFSLTGLAGRPRFGSKYLESWVRGADASFVVSELLGEKAGLLYLALEGSYVNRYERLDKNEYIDFEKDFGVKSPSLNMYSGRLNLGYGGLTLKGEYVRKQDADIATTMVDKARKGEAFLGEVGFNIDRFAMLGTFRKLSYMCTAISIYEQGAYNNINYLPTLTRQYTYSLANLNPYIMPSNGEIGGQVDLYYSLGKGAQYWNFHANFSNFYTNKVEFADNERLFVWRDINFDVERQWNRNFKTTFLYSNQKWDPNHGLIKDSKLYTSNIFVLDVLNKFSKKSSLRTEIQYLQSKDYEKDWIAAALEFSFAPKWSIFVSDMYNFDSKIHYYNGGFSYSKDRSRVQLSYGRTREGYVCSGGVCRYTPAFTGLNFMFTTSL